MRKQWKNSLTEKEGRLFWAVFWFVSLSRRSQKLCHNKSLLVGAKLWTQLSSKRVHANCSRQQHTIRLSVSTVILVRVGNPATVLQRGRDLCMQTRMKNLAVQIQIFFLVRKKEGVLQREVQHFRQSAAANIFLPTVMPLGCLEENWTQHITPHFCAAPPASPPVQLWQKQHNTYSPQQKFYYRQENGVAFALRVKKNTKQVRVSSPAQRPGLTQG